jgi:ketosteroid isomerase-like protein
VSGNATLAPMDSMAGPVEPGLDHADSPNLRVVKGAFVALGDAGLEAAIEHLLDHAHEDVVFCPYVGEGQILRGREEVLGFYRGQLDSGTVFVARPSAFEECDDDVIVVKGTLRVVRPTGGFAESQISWTYRFRDGLLQEARWGPRRAA